jgi:hypothetical protein
MKYLYLAILFSISLNATAEVETWQLQETRLREYPIKDSKGQIVRSSKVIAAFRKVHPCPSTGKYSGACVGWAVDHVIPLKSCGFDAVSNMQWLPDQLKSCSGDICKDRWERKINQCAPVAGVPNVSYLPLQLSVP